MTFDLQRILESKRAYRQGLVSRPIGEKLRMLDALNERELAIRGRSSVRLNLAPSGVCSSAFMRQGRTQARG